MIKILFLLFPLLEIAGFIVVGKLIGVFPTILLIVASSCLGLALLRRQGLHNLEKAYQHRTQGSSTPVHDLLEGPIVVLAGFLLLIPGFITDIIGLIILIPGVRQAIVNWLIKKGKISPGSTMSPQPESRVIEGEFWRENKTDKPDQKPEDKPEDKP